MRLHRSGPVWLMFGAILGPVALLIVQTATPGLCRACWRPTRGWLPICAWCHESVWEPSQQTRALVEKLSTRAAESDRPWTLMAPVTRPAEAPIAKPTKTNASAPVAPVELVTAPTPEWSPWTLVAELEHASSNGSPKATQRSTRAPPAASHNASPGLSSPSEFGVRASAIYITGSSSLESGRRYTIAVGESRLRILGPVDIDPERVALDRVIADVDASAIESRLVVSEPGNRSGMVLVFMSFSGMTADDLARTIVESAQGSTRP